MTGQPPLPESFQLRGQLFDGHKKIPILTSRLLSQGWESILLNLFRIPNYIEAGPIRSKHGGYGLISATAGRHDYFFPCAEITDRS
jgi:hypothetical protein